MQLSIKYLLLLAILVGCVKFQPSAPLYVKDIEAEQALIEHHGKVINGQYIVKKGDTLYSIGFRFEQTYKTLARWNSIKAPYHLEAGQKITLFKENNSIAPTSLVSESHLIKEGKTILMGISAQSSPHIVELPYYVLPPPVPVVIENTDKPDIERSTPLSKVVESVSVKSIIKPVVLQESELVIKLANEVKKEKEKKGVLPVAKITKEIAKVIKRPLKSAIVMPIKDIKSIVKKELVVINDKKITLLSSNKLRWQWPVKGKILKNFYQTNKKGIDIESDIKTDVKAAESGVVVYSGNGLVGYGNLLIIKHNEKFLSAYGNNSKLLVKEGQTITRGQVIALIGVGVKNGLPSLHFEIRKDGKSVNPTGYLK